MLLATVKEAARVPPLPELPHSFDAGIGPSPLSLVIFLYRVCARPYMCVHVHTTLHPVEFERGKVKRAFHFFCWGSQSFVRLKKGEWTQREAEALEDPASEVQFISENTFAEAAQERALSGWTTEYRQGCITFPQAFAVPVACRLQGTCRASGKIFMPANLGALLLFFPHRSGPIRHRGVLPS